MDNTPADITQTVVTFLTTIHKLPEGFGANTSLYAGGAGLDSLETAELSAILEDEHGTDPFSEGLMAQNLDEIIAFYSSISTGA